MLDGKEDEHQAHKHSQTLVGAYGSRLGKWLRYSVRVVRPDSKFQKLRGLGPYWNLEMIRFLRLRLAEHFSVSCQVGKVSCTDLGLGLYCRSTALHDH